MESVNTTKLTTAVTPARLNLVVSFFIAAAIYLTFAWLLKMQPGAAGIEQPDLVFNIDVYQYVHKLGNLGYQELNSKHLLRMHTWVPLTRVLFPLFDGSPHEQAVKAAVMFNIITLSLAFTAVSWFALRTLQNLSKVWLLNVVHLLSTSSLIMSAPDHFSQSYLLMITAILSFICIDKLIVLLVVAVILGIFIAGTTTSNAAFAGLLGYFIVARHFQFKAVFNRLFIVAFLLAPVVGGYLFYLYTREADPNQFLFLKFFNFRLFNELPSALVYCLASWVYPIVAPLPELSRSGHITLEPIALADFFDWYLIPSAVVLTGIGYGIISHWRKEHMLIQILVAWIGFNAIFHNVWGDEYILFTGHYSFALIILIMQLFKQLKTGYCLAFSVPVIIWQGLFAYTTFNLIP
ncbi:hypothetical protein GCM10011369_27820 [Neiella marina]|uniref:Uncharacterized protein n=1 Tax=Neiella marina TaxID=508461 RepID=A0A8J2U7I9_9GAMM|nr:hypothetical protein [Neiella marina]GGA84235.1 hypothetical protein GCM10011369_27820 [Neiella marina]